MTLSVGQVDVRDHSKLNAQEANMYFLLTSRAFFESFLTCLRALRSKKSKFERKRSETLKIIYQK